MQKIFLAIKPKGLQQALETTPETGATVWCGEDAITEQDFRIHRGGFSFTRFSYPLAAASAEVFASAIETIREHHPEATFWIEATV